MVQDELEKAERFQRLFVEPLVNAVRAEVKPLAEGHKSLSRRVAKLEQNQSRAIWGLSAAATAGSVVIGVVLDWVKRKLGWGH